ncbi:MAG: substrate-binding domain-containing protein, partial [Clostridiales bacterium]
MTGCGKDNQAGFDFNNDITVVSREDGSGTRGAFIELFDVEEKDAEGNKKDLTTTEATIVNSTSVVINTISSNPYAIGYISLGSLSDNVKALQIDGQQASIENIKNGSYKIARPFNIATKGQQKPEVKDFIGFIMSEEGQKVVEAAGYIPIEATAYQSNKPKGKIIIAGSSSVTPVMEKLKEAYLQINPNLQMEIQQNDSSTGISFVIDGNCDIGMASRDFKDSEKAVINGQTIAMDGIVMIVNKDNPLENLAA